MSAAARWRSSLRALFARRRMEREMQAELEFHLEAMADELAGTGVPRDEALRRARLAFGGVEARKEECREAVGLRLFDELRADLRFAARQLRAHPSFTAVAVLSLALGIGANTAIFGLARAVLFRTMGVPKAEELRMLSWERPRDAHPGPAWGSFGTNANKELVGNPFPYPLLQEMRRSQTVLQDLALFKDVYQLTATVGGEAEAVDGMLVSGDFSTALAVPIAAGRAIAPADDQPSAPAVAVLSHAYWERRFAAAPSAIGTVIRVNGEPVTVVGVHAARYRGPKAGGTPEIFLPLQLQPRVLPMPDGPLLANPGFWWLMAIGRLRPGVTDAAAQAALDAAYRNAFHATLPQKTDADRPRLVVGPGARGIDLQSQDFAKPLFLLLGLAGIVLLVACANLANLLLARAAARRREIAVRLALGAGRGRLLRQVLTESLLLAGLGGGAGLLLGFWGRDLVPALFAEPWQASTVDAAIDGRVLAFTLGLTLLTGLLFGLAPAWRATRTATQVGLDDGTRTTVARPRARLAKTLVAAEVALCALLLVGAGLFLRTLRNLRASELGLDARKLVVFELDPPRARFSGAARVALFERLETALARVPGVEAVALSSEPLLANSMDSGCFRPAGRAPLSESEDSAWSNQVGARFFEAFAIPVLLGRGFDTGDTARSPRVGIVNRALAKAFFPDGSPLGRTLVECGRDPDTRPITVVGVAADAKYASLRDAPPPTLYLPYRQQGDLAAMTFELKTAAPLESLGGAIRAAVAGVDRDLPVLALRTQSQQIDATLSQERVFALLSSGFGLLAVVLAMIGVYGVMAYTVSRRTHEIGIRVALGARMREVVRMVLGETARLAVAGVLVGLLAALGLSRLLGAMLFGLSASDPLTYAGAGGVLLALALLAGYLPARRAARVDAMRALRHD